MRSPGNSHRTTTSRSSSQRVEQAKSSGIEGVPFFIFDNAYAVSGAQAPEQLAGVIRKAADEKKQKAAG